MHLTNGLKNIKELFLSGIHEFLSEESFKLLSETYSNTLEILKIRTHLHSTLNHESMNYIRNFYNLRELFLEELSLQVLEDICGGCNLLESFSYQCNNFYPVLDITLNNLDRLRSLVLKRIFTYTDELFIYHPDFISSKTNFSNLRKLTLSSDVSISEDFVIQRIIYLKSLRKISFHSLSITNKTLEAISNSCLHLVRFQISYISNISTAGLAKIVEKCKFLTHIEIIRCNINDSDIFILQKNISSKVKIDLDD